MGLGTDNVYLIETDGVGKMDASHLGKLFDTKEEKKLVCSDLL